MKRFLFALLVVSLLFTAKPLARNVSGYGYFDIIDEAEYIIYANTNEELAEVISKVIEDSVKTERAVKYVAIRYRNSEGCITDFSPLGEFTELFSLHLHKSHVSDFTPLSELSNFRSLIINDPQVTDFSTLAEVTNLRALELSCQNLNDISFLSAMTNLTDLHISSVWGFPFSPTAPRGSVSDITPLAGLVNLRILYLSHNGISDISSLSGLTNLQHLHLSDNKIVDITPLIGLGNLQVLNLSYNRITVVPSFSELVNLWNVNLSYNDISVVPSVGLEHFRELNLNSNRIRDISPLSTVSNLRQLHIRNNRISNAQVEALKQALLPSNVAIWHNIPPCDNCGECKEYCCECGCCEHCGYCYMCGGINCRPITRAIEINVCRECGIEKSWRVAQLRVRDEHGRVIIFERRVAKRNSAGVLLGYCPGEGVNS